MTTDSSAPGARTSQLFTVEEQAALRDFWPVYEAHFTEIQAATLESGVLDPMLRQAMLQREPAEVAAEEKTQRKQMHEAMVEGHWDGFLDNLRTQGGIYAQQGLRFSAWLAIFSAAQTAMLHAAHQSFGSQPQRLDAVVRALGKFLLDVSLGIIGEEYLQTRERLIEQQQEAIRELSTPVLPIRPGLLLLPVVGVIDTMRARQLTEQLLDGIRSFRARVVVIDMTGVPAVDSAVANHLLQTVRAAKLLGAATIVTGLSTANAQTLTRIGVDLSGLHTTSDLERGIEEGGLILQSLRTRQRSAVENWDVASPERN